MTRRDFGTVRQLPSGRWQARYRHPRTNERIVAPTTFKMKGDANRWLAGIQRDIERGTWIDPEWGEVTLRDYATSWLTQRTLRPRTVELYQGLLDRYILPGLGRIGAGRSLSPRGEVLARGAPQARHARARDRGQGLPTAADDLRDRAE